MEIEYQMLKGLLKSKEYYTKTSTSIEAVMFSTTEYRTLFEIFDEYNRKYSKQPSADALAVMIEQLKISESEFEAVVDVYSRIIEDTNPVDVDWLYDASEMYCKKRLMINAVWDSAEALEGEKSSKMTSKELNSVAANMERATNFSFDSRVGEDYFKDAAKRYDRYLSESEKIPCALSTFNKFTGGGFARKALHALMAGTNQGKTRMMCYLAGEYVRAGFNVLYVTLEMSEDEIYKRIDANLFDTKTEEIKTVGRDRYVEQVSSLQHKTDGRLICKQWAPSSAGAAHIQKLMEQAKAKDGIIFDVIFVDHMDIAVSTKFPKAEGYDKGKYVSEELRGLAVNNNVAVIAGTQTNRDGANNADADMDSIAESFAKVMTIDTMILLFADAVMKSNGQQMVKLLKSRYVDMGTVKPHILTVVGEFMRYRDPDYIGDANHSVAAVDKMKSVGNKAKNRLKTGSKADTVNWNLKQNDAVASPSKSSAKIKLKATS